MDQSQGIPAKPLDPELAAMAPNYARAYVAVAVSADVLQVARAHGMRELLTQLRQYCHHQAENAWQDGYSGMGWYELYDALDEAVPTQSDAELDGEVRL